MTSKDTGTTDARSGLSELLTSKLYKENIAFWDRAWSPVKAPYSHVPDLPYLTRMTGFLSLNHASHILDLGCGSGWLAVYLARHGFEVTGIDIAEHAIELARMLSVKESLEIQFDVGDIADMPYPIGSFEGIVANSIFEHLTFELAQATLNRLKNLLPAGGCFVGCFDKVGGGPGQYFELSDGTHVYTDDARRGMLLHHFSDAEIRTLFTGWTVTDFAVYEPGTRFVCAVTEAASGIA